MPPAAPDSRSVACLTESTQAIAGALPRLAGLVIAIGWILLAGSGFFGAAFTPISIAIIGLGYIWSGWSMWRNPRLSSSD